MMLCRTFFSIPRTFAVASLCVAASCMASPAALRSPWAGHAVRSTDVPDTCPALAPVPVDLITDGFYRLDDPTHSIVDPERMKAYEQSARPPKAAGLAIVQHADRFRTTGSRQAAACTLQMIDSMAQQRSMTGRMSSGQAYYVQGWIAGAIAIAYLKVRDAGLATPEQNARIAAWLQALGESTRQWYDAAAAKHPLGNNHLYWAGVELAAIGVVANNSNDMNWAYAAYRNGVQQIASDGTLKLEMDRGTRALHYHLYALAPLVMIAEIGESNGQHLYTENNDALLRLTRTSIAGLGDAALFEKATGVKQEVPRVPSGDAIGWAPPFAARYHVPGLKEYIAGAPTLEVFYLGGLPRKWAGQVSRA